MIYSGKKSSKHGLQAGEKEALRVQKMKLEEDIAVARIQMERVMTNLEVYYDRLAEVEEALYEGER